MNITVFVINFYNDLIKFLSLSMNLFNYSILKCYRELRLWSTRVDNFGKGSAVSEGLRTMG